MAATTIALAKKNLSQLVSDVINDISETVVIVNESGKNAVLVSEDNWKSLQETLYLYAIPGMVDSIVEAGKESLSEYSPYDPNEEW